MLFKGNKNLSNGLMSVVAVAVALIVNSILISHGNARITGILTIAGLAFFIVLGVVLVIPALMGSWRLRNNRQVFITDGGVDLLTTIANVHRLSGIVGCVSLFAYSLTVYVSSADKDLAFSAGLIGGMAAATVVALTKGAFASVSCSYE